MFGQTPQIQMNIVNTRRYRTVLETEENLRRGTAAKQGQIFSLITSLFTTYRRCPKSPSEETFVTNAPFTWSSGTGKTIHLNLALSATLL